MTDSAKKSGTSFEVAYSTYVADLWVRRTRILCIIALGAIPTGVVLDRYLYPEHFSAFVAIRVITELLLGTLLWFLFRPSAQAHHKFLGFGWMFLPIAHLSTMIGLSDGIESRYYIALILVVMGACLLIPWTFKECVRGCAMTWSMYAIACGVNWAVYGHSIKPEWWQASINNAFFMVIFPVIGLASSYAAEGSRFREFKLRFDLDQKKKELETSYKKLAELDRAKSQFFANISHELRTPLTLIVSPLDELRAAPEFDRQPKMREILDIMYGNANRLLALINDLLDLVKLDDSKLSLKLKPVDLKLLLPGLVASMRGAAEKARLKLEIDLDENSPLVVAADKDRLEKVFINLVFNAIKFTPAEGTVRVIGRKEKDTVLLEVRDTGIGIAEDKLGEVFKRFWQEDGSATRVRQGTGIGLALVKELVELHGGSVSVQSQKGVGSTFTVRLPSCADLPAAIATNEQEDAWLADLLRKAQRHHEISSETESRQVNKPSPAKADLLKHTLLIVEDDSAMQRFLTLELQDRYNIVVASDGQSGYEMAQSHQPKLILTDMMLPKMDGIALCRKLKASPTLLPTRIVLLTARADDRTKLNALDAGADDFLTKPFSTVELKTRLANLLLTAQLERELQTQNQVLESTLKQLRAAEGQLIQTERLSALGNLSAGIMHEINNPINFMITAIHFLKSSLGASSPDAKETIGDIETGLKRIRDIIADLKSFAYGGTGTAKGECDGEKILRTARRLLAHEIRDDVRFEEILGKESKFFGNENQLVQLLVNLIQNALHATASNSKEKTRHLKVRLKPEGARFVMSVWDNGVGIPEGNISKVFDPFFTTKPVGEGMGLGLSISHTIVRQHRGEISVNSRVGEFTEFTVRLPLDDAASQDAAEHR